MVVCLLGLERHNLLTCWIKVPRLSSKVPVALPSSLLRMGEVEFSSLWNEKKKKKTTLFLSSNINLNSLLKTNKLIKTIHNLEFKTQETHS